MVEGEVRQATPRGFEPLRAEPNGFRVHLLSRSDTVSCLAFAMELASEYACDSIVGVVANFALNGLIAQLVRAYG